MRKLSLLVLALAEVCVATNPDTDCPEQQVLHGSLNCTNSWEMGSRCTLTCDEPYVSVDRADTTTCMSGNIWMPPALCCRRECPPHFLYDFAVLYHTTYGENKEAMKAVGIILHKAMLTVRGSANFAEIYFSDKPLEETRIDFFESADLQNEMELFEQRILPANNTGQGFPMGSKAITFAVQHMLTEEAGARKSDNIGEAVILITDNNLDNLTKTAAQEAADEGILIYIIAIENKDKFLRKRDLENISDRVFYVDGQQPQLNPFIDQTIETFCRDQCKRRLRKDQQKQNYDTK